jgi:hypothetical protein
MAVEAVMDEITAELASLKKGCARRWWTNHKSTQSRADRSGWHDFADVTEVWQS